MHSKWASAAFAAAILFATTACGSSGADAEAGTQTEKASAKAYEKVMVDGQAVSKDQVSVAVRAAEALAAEEVATGGITPVVGAACGLPFYEENGAAFAGSEIACGPYLRTAGGDGVAFQTEYRFVAGTVTASATGGDASYVAGDKLDDESTSDARGQVDFLDAEARKIAQPADLRLPTGASIAVTLPTRVDELSTPAEGELRTARAALFMTGTRTAPMLTDGIRELRPEDGSMLRLTQMHSGGRPGSEGAVTVTVHGENPAHVNAGGSVEAPKTLITAVPSEDTEVTITLTELDDSQSFALPAGKRVEPIRQAYYDPNFAVETDGAAVVEGKHNLLEVFARGSMSVVRPLFEGEYEAGELLAPAGKKWLAMKLNATNSSNMGGLYPFLDGTKITVVDQAGGVHAPASQETKDDVFTYRNIEFAVLVPEDATALSLRVVMPIRDYNDTLPTLDKTFALKLSPQPEDSTS